MQTILDPTVPYHNLANAIIVQAANDYRKALRGNDKRVICDCERFFRSHWYLTLTNLDGEVLIEKLRKEYESENR